MKQLLFYIITIFPLLVLAQSDDGYYSSIKAIDDFHIQIQRDKDWNILRREANADSILIKLNIDKDIESTLRFIDSIFTQATIIDSLFIKVCHESYDEFPYRQSGYMDRLVAMQKRRNAKKVKIPAGIPVPPPLPFPRKSLYPLILPILDLPKQQSIPILIRYLSNHSATRCVVKPSDWDEASYYLSVSDIAMELIELITLCDFYDNAAFSSYLFSNLPQNEIEKKITKIKKWWAITQNLEMTEAVTFFLDSIASYGHSYVYTCNNLLSYGDTSTVKPIYRSYYEAGRLFCRKENRVGNILFELGDDVLLKDCLEDIYKYQCVLHHRSSCISYITTHAASDSTFNALADFISVDIANAKSNSAHEELWDIIFNQMANTDNPQTKPILLQLLKIKRIVKGSDFVSHYWQNQYGEQFKDGFRVCDFSLLKLKEIFPRIRISPDWNNLNSLNEEINRIIELESLR